MPAIVEIIVYFRRPFGSLSEFIVRRESATGSGL